MYMQRYWLILEIDSSKLVVKDGSGLSHDNRLSAKLFGDLLFKIYNDPRFAAVIESLPDGGVNGTLNERSSGRQRLMQLD
jgi:serine-type D-Ala-D-Ala carboxypeptidase/endopeptidase (penicillin-binding protein 4)